MQERIASGGTSDVLAWGEGRILKLFKPAFQYAVPIEVERARAVHDAGAPCPAVLDVVEVGGRHGIVYERIDGPLLLASASPDGIESVARRLAELHLSLHRIDALEIPTRCDLITGSKLPPKIRAELLARDSLLPQADALYHGDLHPANVICSPSGLVVIDWVNACRAHAALDVARSYVLMCYQGTEIDETGRRAQLAEAYRDHYLAARTVSEADYALCLSAAAYSLLRAQPANPYQDQLARLARATETPAARGSGPQGKRDAERKLAPDGAAPRR